MGFVARVCQPSTLRILIWPDASSTQNNMAAVSADGSTVCVLILRLNCRSIVLVVRSLRHGFVFEPPLADEGFAVFFDSLRDLVMRALRSVREDITCLCT